MKIEQFTIQKNFEVKYGDKRYFVSYLNSTGQILGLLNRNNWEIYDEDGEELNIYIFKSKKERLKVKKNILLAEKLIEFCIKHFEDYKLLDENNLSIPISKN